jgi:hypothetical protein
VERPQHRQHAPPGTLRGAIDRLEQAAFIGVEHQHRLPALDEAIAGQVALHTPLSIRPRHRRRN